jgi:CRP/FNR family cyclic AMP-dependent transcriptional regulator
MEGLERLLAEHPFFYGTDDADLALVVGCARNVRFAPGQYLFREGEPADRFYVVREGRIALEVYAPAKGAIVIDTAGPGEIVGVSWLFPPYRWELDARATGDVRAVALDGSCLRSKCEENPRLGYALMKRLSEVDHRRRQSVQARLVDVYADDLAG